MPKADGSSAVVGSLMRPAIRAVLIKGEPGTGKTIFSLELLRSHGGGLYVSTRVPEDKILMQYPSLRLLFTDDGVKLPKAVVEGARFQDMRFSDAAMLVETVIEYISKLKDPLVVLDSWDTVARQLSATERLKTENALLALADTRNARLVFTSEEPAVSSTDYLVDAIVLLKSEIIDGRRVRRLELQKLRGAEIPEVSYLFSLHEARFNVFEPTTFPVPPLQDRRPFREVKNSPGYYSTGSRELDAMLGGGLRDGRGMVIEIGQYVGDGWEMPLVSMISSNFIANGGCVVALPTAGATGEMIRRFKTPHFRKEVLEQRWKVARFNEASAGDPYSFQLDPTSAMKSLQIFWKTVEKMSKAGNRKALPHLSILGIDRIETTFGEGEIVKLQALTSAMLSKGHGTILAITRQFTKSNQFLVGVTGRYLKLYQINGRLVLYSIKPPSKMYVVDYDSSKGYPTVNLTPMS